MSLQRFKEKLSIEIAESSFKHIEKNIDLTDKKRIKKIKNELENLAFIELDNALSTVEGELKGKVEPVIVKKMISLLENEKKEKVRMFKRFTMTVLVQHWIMAVSVIILIITGMPIKFSDAAFSQIVMNMLGGIDMSKIFHRVGGTGLIVASLYHLFYIVFTKEGRWNFKEMIPMPKDLQDVITNFKFYFGKSKDKPKFGRFSYIEKFDYWAVYWGCIIMIFSGLALWFETFFMNNFTLEIWQIAHVMHSDEALLATLAIVFWHFYNAHLNPSKFPLNRVMFSGELDEEEMLEEHPLEYERIIAEEGEQNEQ